ncbi:autotransporter outer membrane beta-barrel domain-containing protein [Pseudomonas sp. KNUC1026]|uniref:autotransporter outer membrane beta-barrel domain-containing protein n=1 Tax=Pseudomonas sp. KNUC1026 TaxID=2893890 RepID=UPI001F3164CF|nr:autotransporter outer membrane beta-barrel domain-containing protein [Pseudomonas sp. KNUC1026]UFH48276.1 autotransporter outer membrane beta-barrel domain-containing protein [Pseudomonas sp. KNUC1026]
MTGPRVINGSTPITFYNVYSAGSLTGADAKTQSIDVGTGGTVSLSRSVITRSASDTNNATSALSVTGEASISDSLIDNQDAAARSAVEVMHNVSTDAYGKVDLANTTVNSVTDGVRAATGTKVTIQGGSINASKVGLLSFGTTLNAVQTRITGAIGVQAYDVTSPVPSTLNFIGSSITGTAGPAMQIGLSASFPGRADILLRDGTTLTGSNGIAIQVNENSKANVTVDNSQIVGDYVAGANSQATLVVQNGGTWTGRLTNLKSLGLNGNGQWNMVEDGNLDSLSMNGGAVRLGQGSDFYTLQVGNLSGSGTFDMHADFATDTSDLLRLTGTSTGSHTLQVAASGQNAVTGNDLRLVETADGGGRFSLANGRVDVGAFQYTLVQDGNDWYLRQTTAVTPGAASALALFNATPTVWYGELTSLRSRMGELRLNSEASGGWFRSYGSKYNVATGSGMGYAQRQQGLSLGADGKAPWGDGQWLVGLLAGYSRSDLDVSLGTTGRVDSAYVGAYTTWLDEETGYYFDGVVKANQFRNKADVTLSDNTQAKGNYDTVGLGASAEFGRHLALAGGYFIEPYTQLAALAVRGRDFELDNGMTASSQRTRSLLGKVGTTAGRTFELGHGQRVQPYVRVALAHEFARNNSASVNQSRFDNDLAGSRGEIGAGVAVSMAERWQLHADFDYSHGDRIEQPWGANFGARYNW